MRDAEEGVDFTFSEWCEFKMQMMVSASMGMANMILCYVDVPFEDMSETLVPSPSFDLDSLIK